MLATLTDERFSDPGWIYERKLDGERCLVFRRGRQARLMSRNKGMLNGQYPELVEAFEVQTVFDFIVDGEIVAFDGRQTSFARLQRRMHVRRPIEALIRAVPAYFYVFDLVFVDRYEISELELRHRKALLRGLLSYDKRLRFTPHRNRDGEKYWEDACGKGWEGVIAKRADAPYVHGRSRDWLKFKCVNEQEFVIGGYTDPQGSRKRFGALLIGYYDDGHLVYAGKVGTGFNEQMLRELGDRLRRLERREPPFDRGVLPRKGVHWVSPRLVAQIGFSEWTGDGQLRHPRFMGLRSDKKPRDVVRERPS
jgi:DNA ligase D-like protein (predicted ligase)